jgi:hypothetical protein
LAGAKKSHHRPQHGQASRARRRAAALAAADGAFGGNGEWAQQPLKSAWGVIMLTPSLFVQPPVADAGENRIWGAEVPLTFDGSRSFHLVLRRSGVADLQRGLGHTHGPHEGPHAAELRPAL